MHMHNHCCRLYVLVEAPPPGSLSGLFQRYYIPMCLPPQHIRVLALVWNLPSAIICGVIAKQLTKYVNEVSTKQGGGSRIKNVVKKQSCQRDLVETKD